MLYAANEGSANRTPLRSRSQIAEAEKLEYDPKDEKGTSRSGHRLSILLTVYHTLFFHLRHLQGTGWCARLSASLRRSTHLLFACPSLPQRTNFPARELSERVFPRIVKEHSETFYWPGSPWGGNSTRDQTEGDVQCVSSFSQGSKASLLNLLAAASGTSGTAASSPTRSTAS